MADLQKRFREHTLDLFAEHGIHSLGYWTDVANPDVLIYLIRHDRDPAVGWEAFKTDPRWIKARHQSLARGPLTINISSVYMQATNFSPMAFSL
jgi:hypothetical protein